MTYRQASFMLESSVISLVLLIILLCPSAFAYQLNSGGYPSCFDYQLTLPTSWIQDIKDYATAHSVSMPDFNGGNYEAMLWAGDTGYATMLIGQKFTTSPAPARPTANDFTFNVANQSGSAPIPTVNHVPSRSYYKVTYNQDSSIASVAVVTPSVLTNQVNAASTYSTGNPYCANITTGVLEKSPNAYGVSKIWPAHTSAWPQAPVASSPTSTTSDALTEAQAVKLLGYATALLIAGHIIKYFVYKGND